MKITLSVKGNVPAFKNTKMVARGRLITDPKKQEVMDAIIDSFEQQLRSYLTTIAGGTPTEQQLRSLTATFVPLDDCYQWIPEQMVTAKHGNPAGAILTLEPI